MPLNPLQGHLFLFRGKAGDRLKAMYWDSNGLVIWYKRLEKSYFKWPAHDAPSFEIIERDSSLLLDGIDFTRLDYV